MHGGLGSNQSFALGVKETRAEVVLCLLGMKS